MYRSMALAGETRKRLAIHSSIPSLQQPQQVVLTGHSLGGGLGKIVSAKLGIPIVAISAPGVYLRCV